MGVVHSNSLLSLKIWLKISQTKLIVYDMKEKLTCLEVYIQLRNNLLISLVSR